MKNRELLSSDRSPGLRSLFSCRMVVVLLLLIGIELPVGAGTIQWTDWTSSTVDSSGFTAFGTITTDTTTVDVTYFNANGVSFFQDGVNGNLIDYFAQGSSGSNGRDPATSPYTSAIVENIPTAAEMIALNRAGTQTLMFSEAIANPVFSYVSLNRNGYAFDQDFEIVSQGSNGDPTNDIGYWGSGAVTKQVVDLGGGNFEYQLIGTGEPHGTIRFTGAFSTVTWRSLTIEDWNGFTVGVEGTAREVFVPEPTALAIFGCGALGLVVCGITPTRRGRRHRRRLD